MRNIHFAITCAPALISLSCIERPIGTGEPTQASQLAQLELSSTQVSDLLIVIDDSASMGDKQRLLSQALVAGSRSVICRTMDGKIVELDEGGQTPPNAKCSGTQGARVGIITTSLEAGGTSSDCSKGGRLVPLPSGKLYFSDGFDETEPDAEVDSLEEKLGPWIEGVGEAGCGYESPLEAMYRFLIDPEPPLGVKVETDSEGKSKTVAFGIDQELLAQRRKFLRDDSQLTILFLTDEDDCSVLDSGNGYRMSSEDNMASGTSACVSAPNDSCCRSCGSDEAEPPDGCTSLAEDPACTAGPLLPIDNDTNVRCFDQKRRFGESLLFPVERYIQGLTSLTVMSRKGEEVNNPLFAGGRTPSTVKVSGIVGVPWQLVATADSRERPDQLVLRSPEEMSEIWPQLLSIDGRPPESPYMLESLTPRVGLPGPNSARDADAIVGHEYDNPFKAALQHACVFPLPEALDCTDEAACDCASLTWSDGTNSPLSPNSPVCQAPSGKYGGEQYAGRAFPATRILSVLKAVNGFAASICPKSLNPSLLIRGSYGYNSWFRKWSAVSHNREGLCLPYRWPEEAKEREQCKLIEVLPRGSNCDFPGRTEAPANYGRRTLRGAEKSEDFTYCAVAAVEGDPDDVDSPAHSCANELIPKAGTAGYCLIEPETGLGSEDLVKMCPKDSKRRVRLVPDDLGRSSMHAIQRRWHFVCPP